jgi:hypothetical protein
VRSRPAPISRLTSGRGPFAVACQEYVRRFKTREAAERFLAELAAQPHCPYAHQIEEDPETP